MKSEKDLKKSNANSLYIITAIQSIIFIIIFVLFYLASKDTNTITITGVIIFSIVISLIILLSNWILYRCSLILAVPFWILWVISLLTGGLGTVLILLYTLVVYSQGNRQEIKKASKKKKTSKSKK